MKNTFWGINLNPSYQRELCWDLEDKILLIDSIFNGRDIGRFSIVFNEFPERQEILDGKQRFSVIIDFIEDRFEYKGFKFSELSNLDKNKFKNFSISISKTKNLTEKEKIELFLATNKTGKPISKEFLDNLGKKISKKLKI